MTYSPRPEDLAELPMPDEWRDVADSVMPWNRELMAERFATARGIVSASGLETLGTHAWGAADQAKAYAFLEDFLAVSRDRMLLISTAGDDQAAGVWRNIKGGFDPGDSRGSFTRLIFDP